MEDEFSGLSKRLRSLEDKVYGQNNDSSTCQDVKISESLVAVNNRLENGLAGRERIKSVLKRIGEIERYLDPTIGEKMTMDTSTKLNIILSEDMYVRDMVNQLETLRGLLPVFDSEHIKATPSHLGKLTHLKQIQVRQEENGIALSDEVKLLIASYNAIISLVTKQFILWDEILTKVEIASEPKRKS